MEQIVTAGATINKWQVDDIYAISLFVYDENDNPSEPTVTLGYNTISNYNDSIDSAWDEQEAKWNYAFWLQNEELIFGIGETKKIIKEWVDNNFLNSTLLDEDDEQKITKAFVAILIEIVKELHSSNFIKDKFNKEIPILIHELEYYDEIANQNIEANSYELVKEFVDFCIGF